MINVNFSVKIKKNITVCKKYYIWNPPTCNCENGKYLGSIIDDSVIMCDEIIEETQTISTYFNEKITCKTKNFFISLTFLIITIALLIAVNIYCY